MRIGYLTWSPEMPDREQLRNDTFVNQCAGGYLFPDALLQHSIEDLEPLCVDIGALEQRREHLVGALREQGYETSWPQGTFYVMVRSPIPDDEEFARIPQPPQGARPAEQYVETPGWFRISLTASDEMVAQGIPAFAAARSEATAGAEASATR